MRYDELSIHQIAEICGVTERTAYRYQYGNPGPNRQAHRLLELHQRFLVLPVKEKLFYYRGAVRVDGGPAITATELSGLDWLRLEHGQLKYRVFKLENELKEAKEPKPCECQLFY